MTLSVVTKEHRAEGLLFKNKLTYALVVTDICLSSDSSNNSTASDLENSVSQQADDANITKHDHYPAKPTNAERAMADNYTSEAYEETIKFLQQFRNKCISSNQSLKKLGLNNGPQPILKQKCKLLWQFHRKLAARKKLAQEIEQFELELSKHTEEIKYLDDRTLNSLVCIAQKIGDADNQLVTLLELKDRTSTDWIRDTNEWIVKIKRSIADLWAWLNKISSQNSATTTPKSNLVIIKPGRTARQPGRTVWHWIKKALAGLASNKACSCLN